MFLHVKQPEDDTAQCLDQPELTFTAYLTILEVLAIGVVSTYIRKAFRLSYRVRDDADHPAFDRSSSSVLIVSRDIIVKLHQ